MTNLVFYVIVSSLSLISVILGHGVPPGRILIPVADCQIVVRILQEYSTNLSGPPMVLQVLT